MTTPNCTCPSGDGSLRWPCPAHAPACQAQQDGPDEAVERVMRSAETLAMAVHFKQPKSAQDKARENLRAVVLAALAQAPHAKPIAQFADGENPCVLEWGAVSLPVGDPSRVTEMKLCPTLWDAIAEGALCGFDWRVYPLAMTPPTA